MTKPTEMDTTPCWLREIGQCEKGFEGSFLEKFENCYFCEVFTRASAEIGQPFPHFMIRQLKLYDIQNISKLELANQSLKQKIDELTVLLDISTQVQGTSSLDETLYVIISGLTAGFALGFNRAILFLVDDKKNELYGKLGVGPTSGEEAHAIWSSLANEPKSLSRMITPEAIESMKNSKMTLLAQTMRKTLHPNQGILSRTVIEKKSFLVTDAHHDKRVSPEVLELLQCPTFATVPLMAKDKAVGMIYVDNRFNQEPITEEDMNSLSRFAALAGLAIAESMAYEQIEHFNEQLEAEVEKAQAELREIEREFAHQEKLVALGQMAAGVAHELRNPMTAVRGFAQRIFRRLPDEDANKRYAGIILEEMDRINILIRDVLEYARKDAPVYEKVLLQEVVDEVLFIFKDTLASNPINLIKDYSDLPAFYIDVNQIKQIVTNIVSNGIDVIKEGGDLKIKIYQDGENACLDIQDSGPGIWPEILKHIFNPFFTTKSSGTGLGLSIAHRLAELHGGDIRVKTQIGQGTCFTLVLPFKTTLEESDQTLED